MGCGDSVPSFEVILSVQNRPVSNCCCWQARHRRHGQHGCPGGDVSHESEYGIVHVLSSADVGAALPRLCGRHTPGLRFCRRVQATKTSDVLFSLLCNTHASTRRRIRESPSIAAARVSPAPREGHMAGGEPPPAGRTDAVCGTIYQPPRRYINRQDDISTSSSCPGAADYIERLADRRYHPPSAAGTVLA